MILRRIERAVLADLSPIVSTKFRQGPSPRRRQMMKSSRFSEEQIIGILREHEAGTPTTEICWNQAVIHETGEARDRKGPAPERLLGARLSAWALDLQKMPRMTRWFGPAPQQWEHHRYTPPFANALLQQGQTLAFFSARKTSWSCPGWQRSSMSSSDKSIAGDQCGGEDGLHGPSLTIPRRRRQARSMLCALSQVGVEE